MKLTLANVNLFYTNTCAVLTAIFQVNWD